MRYRLKGAILLSRIKSHINVMHQRKGGQEPEDVVVGTGCPEHKVDEDEEDGLLTGST